MKDFVLLFLMPPTPFFFMLALGLIVPLRKIRRIFLVLGAALLLLTSIPVTAKVFTLPLFKLVEPYEAVSRGELPIIVPTAGIYQDPGGRWWPKGGSIRRFQLAKTFAGPLFLVGANPKDGEPAEAAIIGAYFARDGRPFTVLAEGRDSIGSAKALKQRGPQGPQLHLVTSAPHTLRMAAALRAQGFAVVASPVSSVLTESLSYADFVPGLAGLSLFRQAMYEYYGIVLYLFRGDITLKHLF